MASVYAEKFRGRRMADGTRFDPVSNAAASTSLPLGTTAHVTNLKNGRTATVQVRDRGPHRAGRIIDVSPGSANTLGMDRHGTAPVLVAPSGRAPGN
jgi:rare lipoprotein A